MSAAKVQGYLFLGSLGLQVVIVVALIFWIITITFQSALNWAESD